jgi:hypothetical protein
MAQWSVGDIVRVKRANWYVVRVYMVNGIETVDLKRTDDKNIPHKLTIGSDRCKRYKKGAQG